MKKSLDWISAATDFFGNKADFFFIGLQKDMLQQVILAYTYRNF